MPDDAVLAADRARIDRPSDERTYTRERRLDIAAIDLLAEVAIEPRVSEQWRAVLQPALGWSSTFQSTPVAWFALFSYLSTVTLCLCLAAVAANKKEISYASG